MEFALSRGGLSALLDREPRAQELARTAQLRELCRFRGPAVPPASASARFLRQRMTHPSALETIFETLVDQLAAALPDLGQRTVIDGKALVSWAKKGPEDSGGGWASRPRRRLRRQDVSGGG